MNAKLIVLGNHFTLVKYRSRNKVHLMQLHLQSSVQVQLAFLQLHLVLLQPLIFLQLHFTSSKQAWLATGRVVLTGVHAFVQSSQLHPKILN